MAARTRKSLVSGEATWSFNDDKDTGVHSSAANTVELMAGGSTPVTVTASNVDIAGSLTVSGRIYNDAGSYRIPQTYVLSSVVSSIAATTTAGGFFAISNPFGADVLIQNVIVNLGTAASSATATVDIGTAAASNTSSDNLFDGLVITTAGVFQNDVDFQGTNGKTSQKWASNGFVTGTVATGNVSAAVASVYVTAIPISAA